MNAHEDDHVSPSEEELEKARLEEVVVIGEMNLEDEDKSV